MSELAEEVHLYEPPEGLQDLDQRETDGKRLLLYVGEQAFVDVVEVIRIEGCEEMLGEHLLRAVAPRHKAMDLLHHTPMYTTPEEAERVFGTVKPSDEDLDNWYGSEAA